MKFPDVQSFNLNRLDESCQIDHSHYLITVRAMIRVSDHLFDGLPCLYGFVFVPPNVEHQANLIAARARLSHRRCSPGYDLQSNGTRRC